MKSIIYFLRPILESHIWYCADVEPTTKKHNFSAATLQRIGMDFDLENLCSEIDQFFSGVFLAIKESNTDKITDEIKITTETDRTHFINLNGVLIEIRVFDTSYFEIFTEDEVLIKKITEKFDSSISLI